MTDNEKYIAATREVADVIASSLTDCEIRKEVIKTLVMNSAVMCFGEVKYVVSGCTVNRSEFIEDLKKKHLF